MAERGVEATQSSRRAVFNLAFNEGHVTAPLWGASVCDSNRCDSLAGRVPSVGRKGADRFTRALTSSWVLILELGSWFHRKGPVRCPFHTLGLAVSSALIGNGEGKFLGSQAAAGHSGESMQTRKMAADLCLYLNSMGRGGTTDSVDSMVTGVAIKQFVAHLRALYYRTSSF